MKLLYNGTDITDSVSIRECVHEMHAEQKSDALFIKFNDPAVWDKWNPAEGDTVSLREAEAHSGTMSIHRVAFGEGVCSLYAQSSPLSMNTRRTQLWEFIRLEKICREIASRNELSLKGYHLPDVLYPRLEQANQSDSSFLQRLCEWEGCAFLIYDGALICYQEKKVEREAPTGNLVVHGLHQTFRVAHKSYASVVVNDEPFVGHSTPSGLPGAVFTTTAVRTTSDAEATRFATGILRLLNKKNQSGILSGGYWPGIYAGSVITLQTDRQGWNDSAVFVRYVRHDHVRRMTRIEFRKPLDY